MGIGKWYYREFQTTLSSVISFLCRGNIEQIVLIVTLEVLFESKASANTYLTVCFKTKRRHGPLLVLKGGSLELRSVRWTSEKGENVLQGILETLFPFGGTCIVCSVHSFARGNGNTLNACVEFRTLGLGLSCGLELRKASVIHRVRTRNLDQHVTAEQGSSPGNMLGCVNISKMGTNTHTFTFGTLLGKFRPVCS